MSEPPPDPAVARLFIGLWPDESVREAMWAEAERWRWPRGARLVPRAKLHMTLHFLGGVPRERVQPLIEGLRDAHVGAFDLHLDRAEIWPNQVAALSPAVVPEGLLALHRRLQDVLDALGQASAREHLRAHVTLARRARGATRPAEAPHLCWTVSRFALIESLPSSAYRVLADCG